MKSSLEENRIAMIFIFENELEAQQQDEFFNNNPFFLPVEFNGMEFEIYFEIKQGTLAKTFNKIQEKIQARYKIFITTPIKVFDAVIIGNLLSVFLWYPDFGMVGLFGSEMPISGDYKTATNFYGIYSYQDDEEKIQSYHGKSPLFYQSVHMLDMGIFVTSTDIPFDEEVGEDFVMAAQCCRYRRAGHDVGVTYVERNKDIKIAFLKDNCIYHHTSEVEEYKKQLKIFRERYKDIVTPLVSICIPTYNQPFFLLIALQSVLNQTYDNIEIIIGDDSTNEDTKELLQPYLKKYKNIKYFYHGGPLGKKGGKNATFIINKASGEYINVLFHDDVIFPNKIYHMMERFIRDLENKIKVIFSSRFLIDSHNNIIGTMNTTWSPSEDTILDGVDVGRKILFVKDNFLGELSTSLCRKKDLVTKDAETGKEIFDIGVFCGVKDVAYGDVGTWLNLLKSGGQCLFIKEPLSAFRRHEDQNTYDPFIRMRLIIEFMGYITISWLNNIFLRNENEYIVACKTWMMAFSHYSGDHDENQSDDIKLLRTSIENIKDLVVANKFAEVLDVSIRLLLEILPENNSIRPLVVQNEKTGLWEKADDGIMLHGEQRC